MSTFLHSSKFKKQYLKDNLEFFVIYLPHYWSKDSIINKRPIMGNLVFQNICSVMLAIHMSLLDQLSSTLPILSPIIGVAFILGGYFMAAKKNKRLAEKEREMAEKILENTLNINKLEHQHRSELQTLRMELKDMEKELSSWKEKYFQLLQDKGCNNNSP